MCNDSRREDPNAIERSRASLLNKVNTVGRESSKNTNWSDTGGKNTENVRDPVHEGNKHNLAKIVFNAGFKSASDNHRDWKKQDQTGLNAGFKIKQEMQKKIQNQTE